MNDVEVSIERSGGLYIVFVEMMYGIYQSPYFKTLSEAKQWIREEGLYY